MSTYTEVNRRASAMNSHGRRCVFLHAVVVLSMGFLGGACAANAQEALPIGPGDRDKQIQTLARVLEESLNLNGPAGWVSQSIMPSPFERPIKAQYIPSVGAVFTIPVGFSIVDHSAGKSDADSADEDPGRDLWDKHWDERRRSNPGSRDATFRRGDVQIMQTDTHGTRLWARRSYFDSGRVAKLRRTLIEAAAEYGHRLTCVEPSERILLVIEAPKQAMSVLSDRRRTVSFAPGAGGGNHGMPGGPSVSRRSRTVVRPKSGAPSVQAPQPNVSRPPTPTPRTPVAGAPIPTPPAAKAATVAPPSPSMKGKPWGNEEEAGEYYDDGGAAGYSALRLLGISALAPELSLSDRATPRDRWLIAIDKADVDAGQTFEQLSTLVSERRY